jgi:hypothetical protein
MCTKWGKIVKPKTDEMFIRRLQRKAISVVMTAMIILVAAVVLGTAVVLYGTSLFQTGGQTQSISSQGIKMWVNATNSTGVSWGAAAIRNSGDVLVSVNIIQIRGVTVPFSNWYVDTNTTEVTPNIQAPFISTTTDKTGSTHSNSVYTQAATCPASNGPATVPNEITINTAGASSGVAGGVYSPTMLCLQQAVGPTTLTPGGQMIVYFRIPNGVLTPIDSGSGQTVNIFAGNVGGPTTVTVTNS